MRSWRKIPSLLVVVVVLIFACVNPVAALDQQFDDTDEDLAIPISQNGVWVADPACTSGNPIGACAMPPAVGIVAAPYLVVGTGEVYLILAAAGGTVLGFIVASNPQVTIAEGFAKFISDGLTGMRKSGEYVWTSTFKQSKVTAYTSGSEEYHLLQKQLNLIEQDYNDAKNKGRPTKNYDPNNDDVITDDSIRALKYHPYSCTLLFGEPVDKQNGCPKQIRYYGKDGKAEMDIDFSHGEKKPGPHPFSHKHTWNSATGKRSDWIKDTLLEELFKSNPCKRYLEQKYSKNSQINEDL